MFNPIKNLITYISKNASSNGIFGNGSPNNNSNIEVLKENVEMEANKMKKEEIITNCSSPLPPFDEKHFNCNLNNGETPKSPSSPLANGESNQNKQNDSKDNTTINSKDIIKKDVEKVIEKNNTSNAEEIKENTDEEKIENKTENDKKVEPDPDPEPDPDAEVDLLSKSIDSGGNSSLTLVTSSDEFNTSDPLRVGSVDDLASISSEDQFVRSRESEEFCSFESSRHATPLDDDFHEFLPEPSHDKLIVPDDVISIGSAEPATAGEETADETAEEIVTEEEDNAAASFIKLSDIKEPDVVIVNDIDLNSSMASDALSEDPLATDTFAPATISLIEESSSSDNSVEFLWTSVTSNDKVIVKKVNKERDDDCFIIESNSDISPQCQQRLQHEQPSSRQAYKQTTPKSTPENQEELRCDNSDSGLGSETSTILRTLLSPARMTTQSSQLGATNESNSVTSGTEEPVSGSSNSLESQKDSELGARALPVVDKPVSVIMKPLRSNLKRRLDVEDMSLDLTDGSSTSACSSSSIDGIHKKPKRSINFDNVQVYYFPRQQGFGCVPSAGGCTLGMGSRHIAVKTLTLAEHAAELRRAHRLQLQDNPRGSSSEDSEESEEDYLSEGSGSDIDAETNGFLQPMSPKQRRALLKAAGVRKIDASEKAECRDIRNSREVCGCSCRDFCDPETCSCSQAGIKCQVDRVSFPCGCSRDACGNTVGRVEFNPQRVRTHFIHTLMRLEMENRQQQNPATASLCGSVYVSSHHAGASTSSVVYSAQNSNNQTPTNFYNSLQTQSNYSSGYASPAYMPDPNNGANAVGGYYQQTSTSAHYASAELHHGANQQYHQLDTLDSNLFSGNSNATPAYGEIMPNYSSSGTSGYHNMSYETVTPVTLYSAYHHQVTNNYSSNCSTGYSSCAVPSVPPYGSATTTASSDERHYQSVSTTACLSLSSIAPCSNNTMTTDSNGTTTALEDGCGGNFINLNSPIASSSRLSQINDLLQHNRNTTAALVAVTKSAISNNNDMEQHTYGNLKNDTNNSLAATDSIDTPPIMDTQTSSLTFDSLPPPCNPAPIVAVIENDCNGGSPSNPPQMEPPP